MKSHRLFAAFAVMCGLFLTGLSPQDMPVPAKLQAAIFKKVISLDKTLAGASDVNLLVVYTEKNGSLDNVVASFKGVGINATPVSQNDLAGQIESAALVYVMPGCKPVNQLSKQHGVLSLTGVPAVVEAGKAAVGLGLQGKKPKIIVHMAQLKAEGHEISADLLKLANVIQ